MATVSKPDNHDLHGLRNIVWPCMLGESQWKIEERTRGALKAAAEMFCKPERSLGMAVEPLIFEAWIVIKPRILFSMWGDTVSTVKSRRTLLISFHGRYEGTVFSILSRSTKTVHITEHPLNFGRIVHIWISPTPCQKLVSVCVKEWWSNGTKSNGVVLIMPHGTPQCELDTLKMD